MPARSTKPSFCPPVRAVSQKDEEDMLTINVRRYLLWAGVAASVTAIILATRHMDYSIAPAKRAGFGAGPAASTLMVTRTSGQVAAQKRAGETRTGP